MMRAGTPHAIAPGGMSPVTTEPAGWTEAAPIFTPPSTVTLYPKINIVFDNNGFLIDRQASHGFQTLAKIMIKRSEHTARTDRHSVPDADTSVTVDKDIFVQSSAGADIHTPWIPYSHSFAYPWSAYTHQHPQNKKPEHVPQLRWEILYDP